MGICDIQNTEGHKGGSGQIYVMVSHSKQTTKKGHSECYKGKCVQKILDRVNSQ